MTNIEFTMGATNFENPMLDAFNIAGRYEGEFNTFHVYFLSDGSADYPSSALGKFQRN